MPSIRKSSNTPLAVAVIECAFSLSVAEEVVSAVDGQSLATSESMTIHPTG